MMRELLLIAEEQRLIFNLFLYDYLFSSDTQTVTRIMKYLFTLILI